MSPKKAKGGSAASPMSVQTPQEELAAASAKESPPDYNQPPEHISRYAVPETFIQRFPPNPNGPGWRVKKWYVVVKGRHLGVHFDYW
jgi:hypothetical protein